MNISKPLSLKCLPIPSKNDLKSFFFEENADRVTDEQFNEIKKSIKQGIARFVS